ncbi:MAG: CcdB family protein [Treponemataceae bacterium]
MAQFDIFQNPDIRTKSRTPYLMDIQSDQLSILATRIVVPLLLRAGQSGQPIEKIHPVLRIGGSEYIAVVSEMAAIRVSALGAYTASAASERQNIIAACDLLLTGF